MKFNCSFCGKESDRPTGHVNRALKTNKGYVFCNQKCSGANRKLNISIDEKKKLKAQYDSNYRKKEYVKKKKHEAFIKDYKKNPEKYKQQRKKRKGAHAEYCRRPEYKAWKVEYDKKHRAKKNYGEFAECFLIIKDIEKEYNQQEVRQINNLHNKTQKRKRTWKQKQNYLQRI